MLGFNDILGHEQIKEHFRNAVQTGKVSHAYILSGEAGMGRKSLANAFALSLLCEKGMEEPCMQCHACKQVLSGNHPDLIYVTHEKPASIGVDDIREQINDTIQVRPYSSYYKIYIVDEAEKMTVQAQNALLKTIEEPPAYAVILLLTTNQDAFLPTILSRCVKHIKDTDISGLLDYIHKVKEENLDIRECLDFMQMWYRDILMYKTTKDINLLIFRDEFSAVKSVSTTSGYDGLEKILEAIDKARIRLDANVNTELVMELMLLTMKEN